MPVDVLLVDDHKIMRDGIKAILERDARVFLIKRAATERRLADFWELPGKQLFAKKMEKISEFRHQIESDTFSDPRAGYKLARAKLEELSPLWPDLDDLSVAVDLARRALDVASHRLGLHGDDGA